MWLRTTWKRTKQALVGINARLELLERAPVAGVPREEFESLESKLEAFLGLISELRAGIDAGIIGQNDLRDNLSDLRARIEHQTLAISEGIERVTRAENRINNTVQRARKELKKLGYTDSGLEAEDRELRLVDAEGSDDVGMHPVREEVASPDDAPSTVPGVSVGQLRRARGLL